MAKGGIRSPMTPFEQQKSHRMPSTSGTSEMKPDARLKQSAKIQSPQLPFKVKPMNGGSKK